MFLGHSGESAFVANVLVSVEGHGVDLVRGKRRDARQAMDEQGGGGAPPSAAAAAAALLERLERRCNDMQDQLERINEERGELVQANRRMDVEIEVGTAVAGELREKATELEGENERRRAENQALRERVRAMHEACARLEKK